MLQKGGGRMITLAWIVFISLCLMAGYGLAKVILFYRQQVKRERAAMKTHVNGIPDAPDPRDSSDPFARPPASQEEQERNR